MKKLFLLTFLFGAMVLKTIAQPAQSWQFALVSDTHIGNETAAADLRNTIKDINANDSVSFVIISGDITEFGSDRELMLAKQILDSLQKPWYIVPGNHDTKWSESGGNSFRKIFGAETFSFKHEGILFLGNNSGPNLRMGGGQVPRENLIWMDSVFRAEPDKRLPVIFVNHYPQNSSLNNWYEVIDRLKDRNTQLILCGHGHANRRLDFEGIPGIMGRSALRASDSAGGYNIIRIADNTASVSERKPLTGTRSPWAKVPLYRHDFKADTARYPRPDYSVNSIWPLVKPQWKLQENSDIGGGVMLAGGRVIYTNTNGWIKAVDQSTGKVLWKTKTGGKIYATPAVSGNRVIVASTDQYLYCFNVKNGRLKWKQKALKPIVSSPVIAGGKVFAGGSDGHFRCYVLKSGKQLWDFDQVEGFVETRPLLYNGMIYFGSWGNHFYALNQKDGRLVWDWKDGHTNRMFSPAACIPVATNNRVFIVAPDNAMTCFNALNGQVIWRKKDSKIRVRESISLSTDSNLVFVKTMEGEVLGISATASQMEITWHAGKNLGYEISPTPVKEFGNLVFAPTSTGEIYAFDRESGDFKWSHKISNCLVNQIMPINAQQLIATTMDGVVAVLNY